MTGASEVHLPTLFFVREVPFFARKSTFIEQCGKVLFRIASSAFIRFYSISTIFMALEVGFAQKIVRHVHSTHSS